jgi:hypothetical protein
MPKHSVMVKLMVSSGSHGWISSHIGFIHKRRDPFWKLSHRLRQLQPDHPEIVGGSGASKWDPGDDHDTIALLGCALIKHLRSSAVDHLVITRDVLGNHTVGSPQQRQLSGRSGFR